MALCRLIIKINLRTYFPSKSGAPTVLGISIGWNNMLGFAMIGSWTSTVGSVVGSEGIVEIWNRIKRNAQLVWFDEETFRSRKTFPPVSVTTIEENPILMRWMKGWLTTNRTVNIDRYGESRKWYSAYINSGCTSECDWLQIRVCFERIWTPLRQNSWGKLLVSYSCEVNQKRDDIQTYGPSKIYVEHKQIFPRCTRTLMLPGPNWDSL